jgi:hypothetical protein
MLRSFATTLLFSLCFSAYAGDKPKLTPELDLEQLKQPSRESRLQAIYSSGGRNSYRAFEVGAGLGLSPSWALNLDFASSSSQSADSSRSIRMGADVVLESPVLLRGALVVRREPDFITALGATFGAEWEMSSLWNGEARTTVSADIEALSFRVPAAVLNSGSQRLTRARFYQVAPALQLRQELVPESLEFGFSYSFYLYGIRNSELSRYTGSRVIPLGGAGATLEGFPKSSFVVDLRYPFLASLNAGVSYTRSEVVNDGGLSRGFGADLSFEFTRHWAGILEVSAVAGTQTGIGVIYSW